MTRKDKCHLQQKAFKSLMIQADIMRSQLCFTDVTLKCENQLFPVHKVIVGSVSEFFKIYFSENELCKLLEINFVRAEILERILLFCYTGRISIQDPSTSLLLELIEASRHLEIPIIYNHCFKLLFNNCTSENLLCFWQQIEDFNSKAVKELFLENILTNLDTLKKTRDFFHLSFRKIDALLDQPLLGFDQHLIIEAILLWVKYNQKIREKLLTKLLMKVHLKKISEEKLPLDIRQDSLLKNNSYFQEQCNRGIEMMSEVANNSAPVGRNENSEEKVMFDTFEDEKPKSNSQNMENKRSLSNEKNEQEENFRLISTDSEIITSTNNESITVKKIFIYGIKEETVQIVIADLNSGEIVELREHPLTSICRSAVCSYNNCIYYFGGRDNCYNVVGDCHVFNVIQNQWSRIASMKIPRFGATAVELDGCIYVAGGSRASGPTVSVEKYDPNMDEWNSVANLPFSKSSPQIVTIEGRLCFVGHENMFFYSPQDNKWSDGDILPKEIMYSPVRVTEANGKMYVLRTYNTENVYIFDAVKKLWSFETIPVPLVQSEAILNLQNAETTAFLIVNDDMSFIYRPPTIWESFKPINLKFPTPSLVNIKC